MARARSAPAAPSPCCSTPRPTTWPRSTAR
jgi:hypothetical protein